jgi:ArsR family transcriptional regulator
MADLCDKVNKFGKGIGNEHRYHILEALMKGERTVGELVAIIKLSQPAISQHLKVLKECYLVTDEKRGQEVYYTLNVAHTLGLLTSLVHEMKHTGK